MILAVFLAGLNNNHAIWNNGLDLPINKGVLNLIFLVLNKVIGYSLRIQTLLLI